MTATTPAWTEPTLIVDNDGNPSTPEEPNSRFGSQPKNYGKTHAAAIEKSKRFGLWRYLLLLLVLCFLGAAWHWMTPAALRIDLPWSHLSTKSSDIAATQPDAQPPAPIPTESSQTIAPPRAAPTYGLPMEIINGYAEVKVIDAKLIDVHARLEHLTNDVQRLSIADVRREEQLAHIKASFRTRPTVRTVKSDTLTSGTLIQRSPTPAQTSESPRPIDSRDASVTVLAVDSWNGTPSVAVSRGGVIHFLAPGDTTSDGLLLKSADPGSQHAVFGLPSGQTSTLSAQP